MKTIQNPERSTWDSLCRRPEMDYEDLRAKVAAIMDEVRTRGDEALRDFAQRFDGGAPEHLRVTDAEFEEAERLVAPALKDAIALSIDNVRRFHAAQARHEAPVQTRPGVLCWRKGLPIDRVGLYIPGGTAPLFSTLVMLGVPALLAGCSTIVLCTPPGKNGKIHPAILHTAKALGLREVFKTGGAQAIAAMTHGTASIPRVDKLFGPGNQWVTMAKRIAQQSGTAIDMPAGPSEVLVIADRSANPAFVAADLLSQAEHGADSQVVLLSDDAAMLEAVRQEIQAQLPLLPRRDVAAQALAESLSVHLPDLSACMDFSNHYAPEHLILALDQADHWATQVRNAGSVFIGHLTPESVGDYASGTNHTLPTSAAARAYSGVSLDSFLKQVTFQRLDAEGLRQIGPAVEAMAEAEELRAHARAVTLRLQAIEAQPAANGHTQPPLHLLRPNIVRLKPYSSARDEYSGQADIFLDANENPNPSGLNRYPDPHQRTLKDKVAALKGVDPSRIFLGNGSDEAIDLLFRAFCQPGADAAIITSPTYGMYSVSAAIHDVALIDIPLDASFQPDVDAILARQAKLLFLCSPNNPSANCLDSARIERLLRGFGGIVILDEAYIDFAPGRSFLPRLGAFPNLVVLQTFSKAWGMAAARMGMAFAHPEIIKVLGNIKAPYNLSGPAQEIVAEALDNRARQQQEADGIIRERARLAQALATMPGTLHVYPSDANFLLVRFRDAEQLFEALRTQGIIVRDRTKQVPDALRITIGTPAENDRVLHAIRQFQSQQHA